MRRAVDLPILTALRFPAAMLVVVLHTFPAGTSLLAPAWFRTFGSRGYLGVQFFFVLSGFILAHVYGDAVFSRAAERRRFWVSRVARIYPLYLAALAFAFPGYAMGVLQQVADGAVSVFAALLQAVSVVVLVQAWNYQWRHGWLEVAWSLSCEAFFYAIFPFLVLGATNPRRRKTALAVAALGFVGLVVALVVVAAEQAGASGGGLGASLAAFLQQGQHLSLSMKEVLLLPLIYLPLFVLGTLANVAYRRWGDRKRLAALVLAIACILAVALLVSPFPASGSPLLDLGFFPLACALLLPSAAALTGKFPRFLEGRVSKELGQASFALFLFHQLLFVPLNTFSLSHPVTAGGLWVSEVLVAIVLCIALHHGLEKPMQAWIHRRFSPSVA
jgi:peptidoglycan/LPS O-acetylase OafA/YrhL